MSAATFTLSAFGDEIADDLQEQLHVLRELSVGYLELRGVWGKNVLHLDDDEVGHSSGWHPALTCGRMGTALAISS